MFQGVADPLNGDMAAGGFHGALPRVWGGGGCGNQILGLQIIRISSLNIACEIRSSRAALGRTGRRARSILWIQLGIAI